jgi:D-aminopeptidase
VSTTLVVVATDAALTKSQAQRLATMAQDGIAWAVAPVHTPIDGDLVFAAATGHRRLSDPVFGLLRLGAAAAQVTARAIARGVYEATALPFPGAAPAYRERFPD